MDNMSNGTNNSLAVSDEQSIEKPALEPWMTKTLVIGGLIGAGVGLLSAFLLIKNSERSGVKPALSFREGFKIAVLAFGVVRNVGNLWEE
jgi:hypothetical protein